MSSIRSLTDRGPALIYSGVVYSKKGGQPTLGKLTTGGVYDRDNIEGVTFVLDDSGVPGGQNRRIWTPGQWAIARYLEANSFALDTSTVLLAHFDGDNGSTTMVDGTGRHTLTAQGDAQISTAQAKFGQSLLLDGTGDYVSVGSSETLNLNAEFTIEAWIYIEEVTGRHYPIFNSASDTVYGLMRFPANHATAANRKKMGYFASSNGTGWDLLSGDSGSFGGRGVTEIEPDQWYHIAFVRSNGTFYGFVNGSLDIQVAVAGDIVAKTEEKRIGRWGFDNGNYIFKGNIDDLRVSNTAKYTANFTPPTAPHDNPRIGIEAQYRGVCRLYHEEAGVDPFKIIVNGTEVYVSDGHVDLENSIPIILEMNDVLEVQGGDTPVRVVYLPETYP